MRSPRVLARAERALGVTRVARLTGLDRTGVEVACAIRPTGHVLQVANGKGLTWAEARASAIGEAAELWAAERVVAKELRHGTATELRHRGYDVWTSDLGSAGALRARAPLDAVLGVFRSGKELFTGREVWIPAAAVHCPPPGAPPIGPALWRWTTNGMGAHPNPVAAVRKALLEAIERHELALALPQGFTRAALAERSLDPATLPAGLKRWSAGIAAAGFRVVLCDLTPAHSTGLAVAGALLVELEGGAHPVTAGYACDPSPERALRGALLEAAQSRLTDIHGGRDDVAPMPVDEVRRLSTWVRALRPRRDFGKMPRELSQRAWALPVLLSALRRAGHARAAAVTLSPPRSPLTVVKVVVPSLQVSELL